MTLIEYVVTMRRYWLLILVCTIIGGVNAYVYAEHKTVEYRSSTSVLLTSELGGNGAELLQGSTYVQNLVDSYVQLATSPKVLQPVIDDLSLHTTPARLAERITADSPVNTVLINLGVQGSDPRETATVADAVTKSLSTAVTDVSPKIDGQPTIRLTTMKPATVPHVPVAPNKLRITLLGILIGLVVGIVLALLRRTFGGAISNPDDVARVTDVPVVGEIVEARWRTSLPEAVLNDPLGLEAESLRAMTANLSFIGVDHGIRTIVVTSASPGEAKSSVAVATAMVLAEGSQRVLLIDADLRKPSVHELTGLDNTTGLSRVLIGEDSLEAAIQPGATESLHVLTSGPRAPNPGQLLSSDSMRALIAKSESSYDFVVIDSPPVLFVADAVWLGHMASGALVVARRGKTKPHALQRALNTLASSRTTVSGVVISRARRRTRAKYAYASRETADT